MSSPAVQIRSRVPRLAGAAVERARLSVVPRRRVQAARVPFVTLVSALLLGGIVGLLLFNTSMQQASFAATSLEQQAGTLSARQQTLQMELEDLRSPQGLAVRAQRMGMVLPATPVTLDLATGKVEGQAAPATRADPLRLQPPAPPKPARIDPPATIKTVRPPEGVLPASDATTQQNQQPQQSQKNRPSQNRR